MPELGVPPERTVFVSGIGCAGRFVYYMDTYGVHGIHGRAPALATGLATARPDLSIWVVTGDGDALSIGGNHLIHALRRNVPIKILLFNNQIYGLTKGQYSPTSEIGKVTKSTPFGSQDHPFNPVALALGAEATFVARTVDTDRAHVADVLRAAAEHKGSAFVEIYQNCNVFNDGAFDAVRDKDQKAANQIPLEHGKPIRFGENARARSRARPVGGAADRRRRRGRRGRAGRPRRAPARPEPRVRARAPRGAARPGPTPIGIFRDDRAPGLRRDHRPRARGGPRAGHETTTSRRCCDAGGTWDVGVTGCGTPACASAGSFGCGARASCSAAIAGSSSRSHDLVEQLAHLVVAQRSSARARGASAPSRARAPRS